MTLRDYEDSEIYMSGPSVTDGDIEIVVEMLRNGWYGKKAYEYVEKFEKGFANWHSRKFGIMTPNCTSAIHLLLKALDIGPGDEVIVPNATWIASAAPIIYVGAKPVFVDVSPITWCVTLEEIKKHVSSRTRAVIAVNLYGAMPDYTAIQDYCDEVDIYLIEDAAESLGSKFVGKKSGSFGVASVFSFHRTKTLTTGEGGMVLTSDVELNQRLRFLRDHGRMPGDFYNTEVTMKYMPSNLAASLGYAQLKRIDELIAAKKRIFDIYQKRLIGISGLSMNFSDSRVHNSAWNTVVKFSQSEYKSALYINEYLLSKGIPTRPFFYPLSSLPAFTKLGIQHDRSKTPVSHELFESSVCLPSALNITRKNQDHVINTLLDGMREIKIND